MIQGDSIEYDMLKLACDSLTGDDFFTTLWLGIDWYDDACLPLPVLPRSL